MRRHFDKTVAAVLADGYGMGMFHLIGTEDLVEPARSAWTYERVSEEPGWTEAI